MKCLQVTEEETGRSRGGKGLRKRKGAKQRNKRECLPIV